MLRLLIIWSFLFWALAGFSQNQMLLSGGGNQALFSGLSIDYSLGETVISSETSDDLLITQGFHQFITLPTIEEPNIARSINLYPNPADNYINLKRFGQIEIGAWYTIYNLQGQQIEHTRMRGNPSNINIANFAKGVYIIRVTDMESKLIGIKKFIKL